ncbi:MAG: SDR family oxidoreductase [Deltaproteobacteria bacterium]|nr:SDR family oxidoreductase [Deltaproteobacteria bacterium]MBW2418818.1 SDR family oxidoreductase [Deltaproteobacteria bacterium]
MAGLRDLKGRVAVVTGASSGIGAALARELARRGARVALVARREDRLEALAREIAEAGGEASVHPCDVAEGGSVEAAAKAVVERWQKIDLLINNAGYVRHVLFADHAVDDIERMMRTNYMGAVHWIKQVLPGMREQGQGWIVNVGSFAGKAGQPDESAYSATKFALAGLSEALGPELAPYGISLLCVHPVLVQTEMFTPEVMARMPRGSEKRFMTPERFASETLAALGRGDVDVVIPRRFRGVLLLRALLPGPMRRVMGRVKMAALPEAGP